MGDYREHYARSKKRQITVILDEDLAGWVRATASEEGVPISTVVEAALRRDMEERRGRAEVLAFGEEGVFRCGEPGCGGIAATWASLNLEDVEASWADLKLYFQCHEGHYTLLYLLNADDGTIRYRVERVRGRPPDVGEERLAARPRG